MGLGGNAVGSNQCALELAKELKGTQITANCVAPGPITTGMFFSGKTEEDLKRVVDMSPLGRLGQMVDVGPSELDVGLGTIGEENSILGVHLDGLGVSEIQRPNRSSHRQRPLWPSSPD
ncbi:short-chain type dehydrogenase/reductase [Cinnamomum micranthum f. kanehirae]|uniref:Short-chain type dehydrogenase/reductase n=1 Tax=Cinnamomum micranthum f. kanehirae TaxID=337451 RepID=A0A443NUJ6_9MAGN|nr:short-chain type dehydrogenase/reductase [Cinnamomum micranthum f. kanehirae]